MADDREVTNAELDAYAQQIAMPAHRSARPQGWVVLSAKRPRPKRRAVKKIAKRRARR